MKIYHYGLHYDEERCRIELALYEVLSEPDAIYSPEWLHAFLLNRVHLERVVLDRDILISLNAKGQVAAFFYVQNGAQTYGLFSQRLTLLYALLSFREAFVFVHYNAGASCCPANEDKLTCCILNKSFAALSLKLYDFLLMGTDGFFSFRVHKAPNPACHPDPAAITPKPDDMAA